MLYVYKVLSQKQRGMSTEIDYSAEKTYIMYIFLYKRTAILREVVGIKRSVLVLFLCAALLFCSCDRRSIEDMLVAPSLTADQSAVINAIDSYSDEKVVLKYPTSGDRRYPIQFIDLDSDGDLEAVVFFAIPSEGMYAQMAVLEKVKDQWEIKSVVDGRGTDIRTVRVTYFGGSSKRLLLVEWFTTNKRGEELSAYRYTDEKIVSDFDDTSTSLRVFDFNNDGYDEFCYVSTDIMGRFVLKYVDTSNSAIAVASTVALSPEMVACMAVTAGRTEDGTNAIFVDENIGDEYQVTEVFHLVDNALVRVKLEDFDITELSKRPITSLSCRKFFGSNTIYIPSAEVPFEGILAREDYTYWYAINGNEIAYINTTFVDTELNMALCLPDEWLSRVVPAHSESEQRLITVYDTELEYNVLYIKVLTVGESAAIYLANGYELLVQSGSFRYYIKGNCSEEDLMFIKDQFMTL